MRDRNVPGKHLEACAADLVEVAYRAVGDQSMTIQGQKNVGVYFTYESPQPGRIVHILNHHHSGVGVLTR